MGELPDKVKRLDVLKIEYGKKKLCQCTELRLEIDYQNKLIYCRDCGAIIDPFEAMCKLAEHWDTIGDQIDRLLAQRKEIVNYKPWLLVFRDLESQYRSKQMIPNCPNCHTPFFFEEINRWSNRKMEEVRRTKEKLCNSSTEED